jgi:hypothetical protein
LVGCYHGAIFSDDSHDSASGIPYRPENERYTVTVYGREQFSGTVEHPEQPGRFYFPPLGTLISGAARLMLATAEAAIRERGGVYAFMDTDSVAIRGY